MEGAVGGARIEFHGDNVAETIEGEEEGAAREERVARDRDQEASMVSNMDWDPAETLLEDSVDEMDFDDTEISVQIIPEEEEVVVKKPSEVIKARAAAVAVAAETEAKVFLVDICHNIFPYIFLLVSFIIVSSRSWRRPVWTMTLSSAASISAPTSTWSRPQPRRPRASSPGPASTRRPASG